LQVFQKHIQDIFESYHYPVCLCHPNHGTIIQCNQAYNRYFPSAKLQIKPKIFCWDSFVQYRKAFHKPSDWDTLPFCYHCSNIDPTVGHYSVGMLQMGQETALMFTFSIQTDSRSGKFYSTEDIVQSVSLQYSRLAADLGHEVGNVLTVLSGNLQLMEELNVFKDHREEYEGMLTELNRSIQMTADIRAFADKPQIRLPVLLENVVKSMQRILEHQARFHGVHVTFKYSKTVPIQVDESEIRQVLLNLFKNAYESMENGGTIAIEVFRTPTEVQLSIRDQGAGIPPHIAARIGTPCVSTKQKGSGLGLAICYEKVYANDGRIEFDSSKSGTCFRIAFLPLNHVNILNSYGSDPL
jgi:signal transduction histidine kinase